MGRKKREGPGPDQDACRGKKHIFVISPSVSFGAEVFYVSQWKQKRNYKEVREHG